MRTRKTPWDQSKYNASVMVWKDEQKKYYQSLSTSSRKALVKLAMFWRSHNAGELKPEYKKEFIDLLEWASSMGLFTALTGIDIYELEALQSND